MCGVAGVVLPDSSGFEAAAVLSRSLMASVTNTSIR